MMPIKFWMQGLIAMLWCSLGMTSAQAQKVVLLKAGLTYGLGAFNGTVLEGESFARSLLAGDLGLEFQLGNKWSYSATVQYMTDINKPSDEKVRQNINELRWGWGYSQFYQSSLLLNSRFRYYPKRNPLVNLEGFFIEFGFDLGKIESIHYAIERINWTNQYSLKSVTPITETAGSVMFGLGWAIALSEKTSLELSGGLNAGYKMGMLPLSVKLRQAL